MYQNQKIKIWVDDIRPVPNGYVGAKSVNDTIALIEKIELDGGIINKNLYPPFEMGAEAKP